MRTFDAIKAKILSSAPSDPVATEALLYPKSDGWYQKYGSVESKVGGTGTILSDTGWIALPMSAGWVAYGAGFDTPQYRKVGNTVHLKGFIAGGTTTIGTIVATLPSGFRPLEISHIVHTDATNATARLNVYPDGTIRINSGWSNVWTTFGYISFPVDSGVTGIAAADTGWVALSMAANYQPYAAGFQYPQIRKQGDWVYTRGLITRNTAVAPAGSTAANIPLGWRPPGGLIFQQHLGGQPCRVDVTAAGLLTHQDQQLVVNGYLSVDGMFWSINQ